MKLKRIGILWTPDPIALKGYLGYRQSPFGRDLVLKVSDALLLSELNNILAMGLNRGMEVRFVSPARIRFGVGQVYERRE